MTGRYVTVVTARYGDALRDVTWYVTVRYGDSNRVTVTVTKVSTFEYHFPKIGDVVRSITMIIWCYTRIKNFKAIIFGKHIINSGAISKSSRQTHELRTFCLGFHRCIQKLVENWLQSFLTRVVQRFFLGFEIEIPHENNWQAHINQFAHQLL